MPSASRASFLAFRTLAAVGWVAGAALVLSGRVLLAIPAFIVGVVLATRSDKQAGGHVLNAVLRDEQLYRVLLEHDAIWISERDGND